PDDRLPLPGQLTGLLGREILRQGETAADLPVALAVAKVLLGGDQREEHGPSEGALPDLLHHHPVRGLVEPAKEVLDLRVACELVIRADPEAEYLLGRRDRRRAGPSDRHVGHDRSAEGERGERDQAGAPDFAAGHGTLRDRGRRSSDFTAGGRLLSARPGGGCAGDRWAGAGAYAPPAIAARRRRADGGASRASRPGGLPGPQELGLPLRGETGT